MKSKAGIIASTTPYPRKRDAIKETAMSPGLPLCRPSYDLPAPLAHRQVEKIQRPVIAYVYEGKSRVDSLPYGASVEVVSSLAIMKVSQMAAKPHLEKLCVEHQNPLPLVLAIR